MRIKLCLITGVIILIIGINGFSSAVNLDCVTVNNASCSLSVTILYVGGSGPGNYTRIQNAIENATAGDTVFVYNGTYYENVDINKFGITLIGENKYTTIIDTGGINDAVYVSSGDVTISGFTIQNSGREIKDEDSGIKIYSNYNNIEGNIIAKNLFGIHLRVCAYNKIFRNNLIKNSHGIDLDDWTHHITIFDNYISDTRGDGIACGGYFENHHHNISDNTINYNQVGIFFTGSCNNVISGNTIIGNYYDGIHLTSDSFNNIITNNYISLNAWGIRLDFLDDVFIFNNILVRNYYGIEIEDASNVTISSNTIRDHVSWGIELYLWKLKSNIIVFQNNFFNNNPNAKFLYDSNLFSDKFKVNWECNYWNSSRFLPKIIFGLKRITIFNDYYLHSIWINIDWHLPLKPYDI